MANISKSEYIMFLKHPAMLWLKRYDKTKLPVVDENLQAIFDAGHDFEKYGEMLFSGGVRLGFNSFFEYQSLPKRTLDEIEKGTSITFQGALAADGIICIFDILENLGNREFNLYEIKSSTSVKKDHIYDLAFQREVWLEVGIV